MRLGRDRRTPAERPGDTLERLAHADLTAMKVRQAEHGEQLRQHERVIDALEGHLGDIVRQMAKLDKRLLIMGLVIFSGTDQGSKLVASLTSLVM